MMASSMKMGTPGARVDDLPGQVAGMTSEVMAMAPSPG
jgi:hypothetical protein